MGEYYVITSCIKIDFALSYKSLHLDFTGTQSLYFLIIEEEDHMKLSQWDWRVIDQLKQTTLSIYVLGSKMS
jgi:hypothetical protein